MKKKIALVLAASMMAIFAVGCSGGKNNDAGVPEMPVYNTTETFRIGNWGVPPHANSGYMGICIFNILSTFNGLYFPVIISRYV